VENVVVGPRSFLQFENARGFSSSQRLGQNTNIKLSSSTLEYIGVARDTISDRFGALSLSGGSRLQLPAGGPGVSVSFAGLNREDLATLRIGALTNSYDLGGPASRYRMQLLFDGGLPVISDPNRPAGGQNTGVVPFMVVDVPSASAAASSFVTYDANGLRLLCDADSKYIAQVRQGQNLADFQFRNVNLIVGNPAAVSGAVRVNAIRSDNNVTLTGIGVNPTLQVYSGLISMNNSIALMDWRSTPAPIRLTSSAMEPSTPAANFAPRAAWSSPATATWVRAS
jgi:hypothetical protein